MGSGETASTVEIESIIINEGFPTCSCEEDTLYFTYANQHIQLIVFQICNLDSRKQNKVKFLELHDFH